jgi:AcrR family transcriptional regulator
MSVVMKTTRSYTMRARAEATEATRRRILESAVALAEERLSLEIVLADVAERAGVSVQTVLRHFGSKENLFAATLAHQLGQVRAERETPVGDVTAAVATITTFYERTGDWMLAILAQERVDEACGQVVNHGRALHREWVSTTFAPQLAGRADRDALVDLLIVATDLYTWKLLRRDAGHDQATTAERMLHLVRAVLPAS